ncbi:hypothetical protein AAZX31_19G073900 [Glycine max]
MKISLQHVSLILETTPIKFEERLSKYFCVIIASFQVFTFSQTFREVNQLAYSLVKYGFEERECFLFHVGLGFALNTYLGDLNCIPLLVNLSSYTKKAPANAESTKVPLSC